MHALQHARLTLVHCIVGLLNLRGNDRPNSPLFDAYVLLTMDDIMQVYLSISLWSDAKLSICFNA